MPNVFAHIILAILVWAGSALWSPGQCQESSARRTPFTLAVIRDADLSLRLRRTIAPGTYLYRDRIGVQGTPVFRVGPLKVAAALDYDGCKRAGAKGRP